MSSQAPGYLGEDGFLCYFPTLPYELRYQIGFDLLMPPCAHADPSVAGECQRLAHIELFFPDGFVCNPVTLPAMVPDPSLGIQPPHFFLAQPDFCPPVAPGIPPVTAHFAPHPAMGVVDPLTCPEYLHSRMIVFVRNGQLGECLEINDTPYNVIRQCKGCGEFHSVQEGIHNQPHEQPSASGMAGQSGTSHASPRKAGDTRQGDTSNASPRKANEDTSNASPRTANEGTSNASARTANDDKSNASRRTAHEDTSNASPGTAKEGVATDRKNRLPNDDIICYVKTIYGNMKQVTIEGVDGQEGKDFNITIVGSQSTDELLASVLSLWERYDQYNHDNVPKDKKKTKKGPNVDNDK